MYIVKDEKGLSASVRPLYVPRMSLEAFFLNIFVLHAFFGRNITVSDIPKE